MVHRPAAGGARARGPARLVALGLFGLLACAAASAEEKPDAAPAPIDAMRERIFAAAGLQPGMTVAEIGLGRGWFVFRAAEAVGPDGTVYATDIDRAAIESMQKQLPRINPAAGKVELRLCKDPRDTGIDDLPDGRVDVVFMVDSLCFAAGERAKNVEYLRRFVRVLRPGGRLIHHMDCQCDIEPEGVVAQFTEAGFAPQIERVVAPPEPEPGDSCRSEAARRRHAFIPVFRKPAEPPR